MSRAVVFSAFGGTDVLEIVDVEPPPVGPGQVRVRVETAGIQPFDARSRAGWFNPYIPAEFPQGLGNEFGIQLIGTKRSTERLAELTDLHAQGKLRVIVDRVYPLDQVAQAHAQVEAGHVRGKVVLAIGD